VATFISISVEINHLRSIKELKVAKYIPKYILNAPVIAKLAWKMEIRFLFNFGNWKVRLVSKTMLTMKMVFQVSFW